MDIYFGKYSERPVKDDGLWCGHKRRKPHATQGSLSSVKVSLYRKKWPIHFYTHPTSHDFGLHQVKGHIMLGRSFG